MWKLWLMLSVTALPLAAQQIDLGENVKGKLAPSSIGQDGAVNGQALLWNGTAWVPGNVASTGGVGVVAGFSAAAVASLTLNLTPLSITNTEAVQFECWSGTPTTYASVPITSLTNYITSSVTLNFSSTANVYCSAIGGTCAEGCGGGGSTPGWQNGSGSNWVNGSGQAWQN
jgi:hypothetical protein